MNLFLLGATGRVGRHILSLALHDGHQVSALVRNPQRIPAPHPHLTIHQGDARKQADIAKAIKGAEIVISALSTDGTTTLTESMRLLINTMAEEKIERIITVGTAGILQSRTQPSLLRYQTAETRRTSSFAAQEHHRVYNMLAETELLWTIVCPPALEEQSLQQPILAMRDTLPGNRARISFSATAAFMYHLIYDHQYRRARVGISYES